MILRVANMIRGSKELIRDINTRLVLETIIENESISRAAISKQLGLTKATISAIVQELIDKKLVIEVGSGDAKLGRKPILLSLNNKAGYVISIDIGVKTISALVSDLTGEDCRLKQIKTPRNITTLVSVLIDLIESMEQEDYSPYNLVGISLGIHGVVKDNKVSFAPYYDLSEIDLARELENYFSSPVYLENEANLSAIGENTFQYDYKNIVNISVHSGIGLGLIINHKLYTGYNGRAGEFGHTIIEIGGKPCPCGNKGCLEQYVSELMLMKELAQLKGVEEVDFNDFYKMYQEGDSDAQYIMECFIKYMSLGINNILNVYNPDIVIINSSFTISLPHIIKDIENSLKSRMNSYIKIVPSALQDSSILLGGICVAIKAFLGINNLKLNHLEPSV